MEKAAVILSLRCRAERSSASRRAGASWPDVSDHTPFVAAKGGRGGWGNSHFATPTRQCPCVLPNSGPAGRKAWRSPSSLKLLADVGLLGYPNVGKSTPLSVVSEAKPKIANYPFTTLTPVLGVVPHGARAAPL